jgi:hypothetical protein
MRSFHKLTIEDAKDITLMDEFLRFIVGDARAFNTVATTNFRTFFENVVEKM